MLSLSGEPEVSGLSGGGFVVTWNNDLSPLSSVGQIFDSLGTKIGTEFPVVDYYCSSIAGLSDGGFVATHSSDSFVNVYGQLINNSGVKIGSEFQINTFSNWWQGGSRSAALSNGGFVVTWESYEQGGSEDGIYGQLFNNSGNKIGSQFQVNTYTTGDQADSSVAAFSSGGFIVTWTSSGGQDGDSDGIFGQLFMITDSIPTVSDFASAYGSIISDSNYGEFCDFDDDGSVDGSDLALMALEFGREDCP